MVYPDNKILKIMKQIVLKQFQETSMRLWLKAQAGEG